MNHSWFGLFFYSTYTQNNTVYGNTVFKQGDGTHAFTDAWGFVSTYADYTNFSYNNVSYGIGSGVGLWVTSDHNTVQGNFVHNNGLHGVNNGQDTSDYQTVYNNTIYANTYAGVLLDGADYNNVSYNNISYNGAASYDLYLGTSATYNNITGLWDSIGGASAPHRVTKLPGSGGVWEGAPQRVMVPYTKPVTVL